MPLIKDLLVVFWRIVTILPLMLIVTLCMGKRCIGELPVLDFLIILTLGSVVGADIAEPQVPHINISVAIILIGIFQIIISKANIKWRRFGRLVTFEPTIVIQDGRFIVGNVKKLRYSIDNVLLMLREKDVFDISEVHLGIIEANGKISVLKKDTKLSPTLEDMNLAKKSAAIAYPVIVDGIVYEGVLEKLKLNEIWLRQELLNINIREVEEVFFASVNEKKELHVSLKNAIENKEDITPIYH